MVNKGIPNFGRKFTVARNGVSVRVSNLMNGGLVSCWEALKRYGDKKLLIKGYK